MAKVPTYGTMVPLIVENGMRTKLAVMASMSGLTEDATKETGKTTICMDEGFTLGRMEEGTRESTIMIASMGLAPTLGKMGVSMWGSG
jgi:hypothetical protein